MRWFDWVLTGIGLVLIFVPLRRWWNGPTPYTAEYFRSLCPHQLSLGVACGECAHCEAAKRVDG